MSIYYSKRSDVPEQYTWDLSVLYASDEDWDDDCRAFSDDMPSIRSFAGKLSENGRNLLAYLKEEEALSLRLERILGYASCRADEDTGLSKYQAMRSRAVSLAVAFDGETAYAAPEILAIPEDILEDFYKSVPGLEEYRRPLYNIRRQKAHILSPECENILSAAGEISGSPDNIGGVFRNADMTFPEVKDSKGETHTLTNGSLVPLLMSADRELRKSAYETYYGELWKFRNTFASILDAQFKQLCFFANVRRYSSTLEAALDRNEVPTGVYHNLISAVHDNMDKMYRYVALRKRVLGVEQLRMYDVYTPIVGDCDNEIPYEKARETVLKALSVLGEDYTALLQEAISSRWIDVYENAGKRGGAYSTDIPRPHPFILLNHKNDLDSQFTLAHELGHAMHSCYSMKGQPVSTSDYCIFVAEVASTVNEVLLMQYLLSQTRDRKERTYLINHFLDQFKSTVYRQTMFAEFELQMGRAAEAHEALTAELLCEKYKALNELYFGPDVRMDECIAMEWARIPHFYYDYYVFQYATGFSAAVAIANRILKEGDSAVADYKQFLSGGCSTDPISLLKIAGVDMSTPNPVNDALALFGKLVDELETLL